MGGSVSLSHCWNDRNLQYHIFHFTQNQDSGDPIIVTLVLHTPHLWPASEGWSVPPGPNEASRCIWEDVLFELRTLPIKAQVRFQWVMIQKFHNHLHLPQKKILTASIMRQFLVAKILTLKPSFAMRFKHPGWLPGRSKGSLWVIGKE